MFLEGYSIYLWESPNGIDKLIGSAESRKVTFKGYMHTLWGDLAEKNIRLAYILLGIICLISVLLIMFG